MLGLVVQQAAQLQPGLAGVDAPADVLAGNLAAGGPAQTRPNAGHRQLAHGEAGRGQRPQGEDRAAEAAAGDDRASRHACAVTTWPLVRDLAGLQKDKPVLVL